MTKVLTVVGVLLFAVMLTSTFGRTYAKNRRSFLVVSLPNENNELAILYSDGDMFVCVPIHGSKQVDATLRLLNRSTLFTSYAKFRTMELHLGP
jgi:hypothetical protein